PCAVGERRAAAEERGHIAAHVGQLGHVDRVVLRGAGGNVDQALVAAGVGVAEGHRVRLGRHRTVADRGAVGGRGRTVHAQYGAVVAAGVHRRTHGHRTSAAGGGRFAAGIVEAVAIEVEVEGNLPVAVAVVPCR